MLVSVPLTAAMTVTAFVAFVLYGVTGFGPAIIFVMSSRLCHTVLGLAGDDGTLLQSNKAISGCMLVCGCAQAVLIGRTLGNLKWAFIIGVQSVAGMLAGLWLSEKLLPYATYISRVAGCVLLVVAAQRVLNVTGYVGKSPDPPPLGSMPDLRSGFTLVTLPLFTLSGLSGGILCVAGPLAMLFLSLHASAINLHTYRGTSCIASIFVLFSRVYFLGATQQIDFTALDEWLYMIVTSAGGLLGLLTGNLIARRIEQATFNWLIVILLLDASLLLASADVTRPPLQQCAEWFILVSAVAFSVSKCWPDWCRARRTMAVEPLLYGERDAGGLTFEDSLQTSRHTR